MYAIIFCYSLNFPIKIDGIIATFLIFYFLLHFSITLFYLTFITTTFIGVLYFPVAIIYGKLSEGIVVSIFETNMLESIEFIKSIPIYLYIVSGVFFVFCTYIIHRIKKTSFSSLPLSRNTTVIIILALCTIYKPVKAYYVDNYNFSLENTNVAPIGFFAKLMNNISNYYRYKIELNRSMDNPVSWNILKSNQKYKNYILVIGESMRADYMSLYGYPIDTTPFLNSTNGLIIDGYVSTALNTQPSLQRILYLNKDNQFSYQDNIITLAKSAGLETYWISNQGRIGEFDTVAARVAFNADNIRFTKNAGYDFTNVNDRKILDILKETVAEKQDKPRLFVLHLMGSHPEFCERLESKPEVYFINQDMSCYLETLKQTDLLIKEVIDVFKSQQDYSLIYFSDHGLSHKQNGDKFSMFVNNQYKQNYQVPFIKISSDDKNRVVVKTQRSAFNFMSGFAEWLGVKEETLSKYEGFFSDKQDDIKVFDGDKLIEFNTLFDDPARLP